MFETYWPAIWKMALIGWELLSGACLVASAALVLRFGASASGIGISVNRPVLLYFATVPYSAVGAILWMLGFFRLTLAFLICSGCAFLLSGSCLWLGRPWARDVALGLHSLNIFFVLFAISRMNRLNISQLSQARNAVYLFGILLSAVNAGALWFLFRRQFE